MIKRVPRWFGMVGIVTAGFGCDNVSFGGMSVRLEGPPRDSLAIEGGVEDLERYRQQCVQRATDAARHGFDAARDSHRNGKRGATQPPET